MALLIFQIVVIIFSLLMAAGIAYVIFLGVKTAFAERRQERERANQLIADMTPELREQMKRMKGSRMRHHIVRWEKQQRGM